MTDCPYARLRFPCVPLTEAEAKLAAAEKEPSMTTLFNLRGRVATLEAEKDRWQKRDIDQLTKIKELEAENKRLRAEHGADPEGGGE